jgi:hypothetical protein
MLALANISASIKEEEKKRAEVIIICSIYGGKQWQV